MPSLFLLTTHVLHKAQTTCSPEVTAKTILCRSSHKADSTVNSWDQTNIPSCFQGLHQGCRSRGQCVPRAFRGLLAPPSGHSLHCTSVTKPRHPPAEVGNKIIPKAEVNGQDFSLFHVPQSSRCPGAKPLFLVRSRNLPAASGKGQHLPTFLFPAPSSWAGLQFPQIMQWHLATS